MIRISIPLEKDSPDFEKVVQGFLEQEIEVRLQSNFIAVYIPIDWVEAENGVSKSFKIKIKNYDSLKDVANYLVKEGYRVSYKKEEEKLYTNFKDTYMYVSLVEKSSNLHAMCLDFIKNIPIKNIAFCLGEEND